MQPALAPAPPYRLADHVRACRIDSQVVLLDLRRDRYVGVGGPQVASLSHLIVDWPAAAAEAAALAGSHEGWMKTLLGLGMLADAGTPPPRCAKLPEPREALALEPHARESAPRWRDLPGLAWAASTAAVWMRRRCLAEIARRVLDLRPGDHAMQHAAGAAALEPAVASYLRLSPLLFTADDRCLHDSLALVRFLAGKGLFPNWVIGVRTRPFLAHSWVQSGSLVLNDVPEHVRTFTPIMVV